MSKVIVTYADGAHKELLEVALPSYRVFAERHGYYLVLGVDESVNKLDLPPAWVKIPLLISALSTNDVAVWFDCDMVVVDPTEDFPMFSTGKSHSLVRHFESLSEVPNTGVWRLTRQCVPMLEMMMKLEVFRNHGWWEQAALMALMGYTVPPEGSDFSDTKCKNVVKTTYYDDCQFMRLCWNSHPNYRAERPRIVHCSYPDMAQRLMVMQELVKNPRFDYPTYNTCPMCKKIV